MKLTIMLSLDLTRDAPEQAAREVALDALVERADTHRLGFTVPGPTREEDQ